MIQANKAQTEFQECSHQLTQKVWEELQVLEDKKQEEKGIQERETNDVLEEEAKQGKFHIAFCTLYYVAFKNNRYSHCVNIVFTYSKF